MHLRKARYRDYDRVKELADSNELIIDFKHIAGILVVEDDTSKIIAFGSLVTILEASFSADLTVRADDRARALGMLFTEADSVASGLGYDCYYAFMTNEKIIRVCKFLGFNPTKSIASLIRWVNGKSK